MLIRQAKSEYCEERGYFVNKGRGLIVACVEVNFEEETDYGSCADVLDNLKIVGS